jgi:predicted MPP superfamily phosphohydrolase
MGTPARKEENAFLADPIVLPPLPAWKAKFEDYLARCARSPRAHRLLSVALLIGLPGIGAYASLVEPTWLKIKRLTIPLHNLPVGLDGFRLVHLSDLHVGSVVPPWFLQRVVNTVHSLSPDLIVLTGDFVHTYPDEIKGLRALLSSLQAPHGVFAVLGNHDYALNYPGHVGIPGVEEVVIHALEQAGVQILRNDWVPIGGGQRPFALFGIDELWSARARPTAVETIPDSFPRVVLSHNPDTLSFLPKNGFDLLLCGHTHGGQVRLPPFPPLVTATTNRRLWGGLSAQGRGWLFVTRGIGYTWRVRFAARPECVEITLTGQ